ncbi:transcriptional regulator [Actinosynnema sp. NPDC053489]|uniref:transcriptional regulator n=1 Tax=Actinosynnema sp. NPDC053489 TaxID=3363916 RepID=UPI0037C866FD
MTFDRYMRLAGVSSVDALAQAIRVHRSTLCQVMDGELEPDAAFIAGALVTFAPASFKELFEIVEGL